jgi:DUF971 family protein
VTIFPRDVQALRTEKALQIQWTDGACTRSDFWKLRTECQCAGCVDERTGQRTLDPESVPADVAVERMDLVGNYAVRIHWSDGHSTGLYTWDRLRNLSDKAGRPAD